MPLEIITKTLLLVEKNVILILPPIRNSFGNFWIGYTW